MEHRKRLYMFLAIVAIAVLIMQVFQISLFRDNAEEIPPSSQVSKNDIRRTLAIPFSDAKRLTEENTSFQGIYASLNANAILVDIPLFVRPGNPAYLEYNRLDIKSLSDIVYHIHGAGLEAILNPCLTGNTEILEDKRTASEIYSMYEEWFQLSAGTGANALFFGEVEFAKHVPQTRVLESIHKLYELYTGNVHLSISDNDSTSLTLLYKTVSGFVFSPKGIIAFEPILDSLQTADNISVYFDFHQPITSMDLFAPYISEVTDATAQNTHAAEELANNYITKNWFKGVIIQAPKYDNSGTVVSNKADLPKIENWFASLKKLSIKRAFQNNAPLPSIGIQENN